MEPRIAHLPNKKLIGFRANMSLAENKTAELWQRFMKQYKQLVPDDGSDLYSIQVYEEGLNFNDFNPSVEFEKWAAAEAHVFSSIPEGMEQFELAEGDYAVFVHKGPASTFAKTFQFIFYNWLPNSAYQVADRPHFEVLGPKYKNNDPSSEEEVWIPIRPK